MRRRDVRFVSGTIAMGLVVAALGFAWVMSRRPATARDGQPESGALAFATHCAACHDVNDLVAPIRASANPDTALASLEAFLATHGDSSPEDDRRIREYLASLVER